MKRKLLTFFTLFFLPLLACAGSGSAQIEDETVEYLLPRVFGDAEVVENLQPAASLRNLFRLHEPEGSEVAWVHKPENFVLANRAFRGYFDHLSANFGKYNTGYYGSVRVDAKKFLALESREISLALNRLKSKNIDESAYQQSGTVIDVFQSQKNYDDFSRNLNGKVLAGQRISLERVSSKCAYFSIWFDKFRQKRSYLLINIDGTEISMNDDENYYCFARLFAHHTGFQALDTREEIETYHPSAKNYNLAKGNTDFQQNCLLFRFGQDRTQDDYGALLDYDRRNCGIYLFGRVEILIYLIAMRDNKAENKTLTRAEFSKMIVDTKAKLGEESLQYERDVDRELAKPYRKPEIPKDWRPNR